MKSGFLDNSGQGHTRGEIEFASIGTVKFELFGNMREGLYGKAIRFSNPAYDPNHILVHYSDKSSSAREYMSDFQHIQTGHVGDIFEDHHLYIEWHSDENGRCVIELDRKDCEILKG